MNKKILTNELAVMSNLYRILPKQMNGKVNAQFVEIYYLVDV